MKKELTTGPTVIMMPAMIIYGDAIEVMRNLPPQLVDACITDPPYGTTQNKWDAVIPLEAMWQQLWRVLKPSAAILLHASQPFTSALVMSQPKRFRHEWIWIKNRGSNFANTVREPMKEHESILMFGNGKWTYNKQMQERTGGGVGMGGQVQSRKRDSSNFKIRGSAVQNVLTELRVPTSWQRFNVEVGLHPTQKPVSLARYLIRTYTNASDTVLDFACGSGTTGVACVMEGRKFIGIENDERYVEIAQRRIEEAKS